MWSQQGVVKLLRDYNTAVEPKVDVTESAGASRV